MDVMICLVIQIENHIYEVYFVEHLCVLGWKNQLIFRLPVKEPSLIIMGVVVWDPTVFYVLRIGRLGTCLWEWLAVGVWDPKWSVPGKPIVSYVISDNLVINIFGKHTKKISWRYFPCLCLECVYRLRMGMG